MANSTTRIVDSTRRLVLKMHGDANEASILKVDPATLAFALNANSVIISAGADRRPQYRMALKKVYYDVQSGDSRGYVRVHTDGGANIANTLFTVSGTGTLSFRSDDGDSLAISTDQLGLSTTGNIFLTAVGFSGNAFYTIVADFKKDNRDFDAGQTADPKAFNR
jgi:hypothetical protein